MRCCRSLANCKRGSKTRMLLRFGCELGRSLVRHCSHRVAFKSSNEWGWGKRCHAVTSSFKRTVVVICCATCLRIWTSCTGRFGSPIVCPIGCWGVASAQDPSTREAQFCSCSCGAAPVTSIYLIRSRVLNKRSGQSLNRFVGGVVKIASSESYSDPHSNSHSTVRAAFG